MIPGRSALLAALAGVSAWNTPAQQSASARVQMERTAAADSAWIADAPACRFPAMLDTTGWRRVMYGSDISFSLPPELHDPTPKYPPNDSVHGDWWDGRGRGVMARRSFAQAPGRMRNQAAYTRCLWNASGSRLVIIADMNDTLPFFIVERAPRGRLTPEWLSYFPLTTFTFYRFPHEDVTLVLTIVQTMSWRPATDSVHVPVNGPVSACRPIDEESTDYLFHLKDAGTTTIKPFSDVRDSAHLPILTPSMPLRQITEGAICARAARALDALMAAEDPVEKDPERRIWLYQYGTYYVMGDPYVRMGEWFPLWIFDAKLKYLGSISL